MTVADKTLLFLEYRLRAAAATKSQATKLTAPEARVLLKHLDDLRLRTVLAEAGHARPAKGGRRA